MKKTGSLIAVAALIILGALAAAAPQTAPVRAFIQTVGADTIVQPSPSPSPAASPTAGPVDVVPAPVPVIDPTPDPILTASPAPEYPVVQGAPCVPPGAVDAAGNCVVPDSVVTDPTASTTSVATSVVAPAPAAPVVNPAASQPGQGAPCLPPGVLVGTACVVPQPTPTPGG